MQKVFVLSLGDVSDVQSQESASLGETVDSLKFYKALVGSE